MERAGHWMTCADDHREHFVTEVAFVRGRNEGAAETVCGHTLMVDAATAEFGRRCAVCTAVLAQRACPQPGRVARHRAPGFLGRVLHPR